MSIENINNGESGSSVRGKLNAVIGVANNPVPGPTGPQGETGATGAEGPTGPTGPETVGAVISDPASPTAVTKIWSGTQAQYDAIDPKDANTFYIITD